MPMTAPTPRRTNPSSTRQSRVNRMMAERGVSAPKRRSSQSPIVPPAKRLVIAMRRCSTWNSIDSLRTHLQPRQKLIELIQTRVVDDEPAFAFLGRGAKLHPQAELARDVL